MNVKIKFTIEVGSPAKMLDSLLFVMLTPPMMFPYNIAIILHRVAMPSHMYKCRLRPTIPVTN